LTATVAWSALDPTIVNVSNASDAGTATALMQGSTTVTAQSGGVTGSATFVVTMATLSSIAITPSAPAIANGTMVQLTATGTFSDTSTEDVTAQVNWQSSDQTVALISNASGSEGFVTSVMPGNVTITASLDGKMGMVPLAVNDVTLMSIAVTPATPMLSLGGVDNVQLTAIGTFSDTSTQDLTAQASWMTGDQTVVVVSNADGMRGLCSGVGTGSGVSVSATALGVTGSVAVTVGP
jgi:hypothetical protein